MHELDVRQNMKKLRYALLAIAAVTLGLFAVNIVGKSVYFYFTAFDNTLVIAASQGVCHLALTTEDMQSNLMDDLTEEFLPMPDIGYRELLNLGPIIITVENRLDPVSPFRFDYSRGDSSYNYSAIEFPWLLIPLTLIGTIIIANHKTRSRTIRIVQPATSGGVGGDLS